MNAPSSSVCLGLISHDVHPFSAVHAAADGVHCGGGGGESEMDVVPRAIRGHSNSADGTPDGIVVLFVTDTIE